MSRIKCRNTRPEVLVRSYLHHMGFRFRLHVRNLPGRPDIVLPKYGTVIQVHGCFWHRHPSCSMAYMPRSRTTFWRDKFAGNVARDRRQREKLEALGWRVVTIWECEAYDADQLTKKLRQFGLRSRRSHR
jgi:DNA mismatch endonuclease, patch repair protein